jgi:hypothetical protein
MSIDLASKSTILGIAHWIRENTAFETSLDASTIAQRIYKQHSESHAARYNENPIPWEQPNISLTFTRTSAYDELRHIVIGNTYEGDSPDEIDNYQFCLLALNSILASPVTNPSFDEFIGKFARPNKSYGGGYFDSVITKVEQCTSSERKFTVASFDIFNRKWCFQTLFENNICFSDTRPQLSIQQTQAFSDFVQSELDADRLKRQIRAKEINNQIKQNVDHINTYKPDNTKAVIVAQYVNNDSNLNEDYHGSKTLKTVIIGWSTHTRNLFPEMRKAAKQYEPVAFMAELPKESEHRYPHSFSFLKESSNQYADGWMIYKINISGNSISSLPLCSIADHLTQAGDSAGGYKKKRNDDSGVNKLANTSEGASGEAAPNDNAASTPTMRFNDAKGGIELVFASTPSQDVLKELRASNFRWHNKNKYWFAKRSDENLRFATRLVGVRGDQVSENRTSKDPTVHVNSLRKLLFGVA